VLPDVKFGLASSVCCWWSLYFGGQVLVSFLLLTEERAVAESLLFAVDQISTLAKKKTVQCIHQELSCLLFLKCYIFHS